MSKYYLLSVFNIHLSFLRIYHFSAIQIINTALGISVLRGDITYCCRKIICLYKISEIIPSPSLTVFFSSTHRNINRNVIGST